MRLFIIGMIIGLGKVLPGVSGSVLAIRFNVYEKILYSICNFFKDIKTNSIFLSKIAIGFIIMIIISSKVLYILINKYAMGLKIIFTILILSGVPDLLKRGGSYLITLISFLVAMSIVFLPNIIIGSDHYFVMGIIESFSTIIPGISGTAIYLSLGWYQDVLLLFSNLHLFEFSKIIPFIFGLTVGSIIFVNLIVYLFKQYKKETYSSILGFLLASIILIYI
jgi:Predicted membrane protein